MTIRQPATSFAHALMWHAKQNGVVGLLVALCSALLTSSCATTTRADSGGSNVTVRTANVDAQQLVASHTERSPATTSATVVSLGASSNCCEAPSTASRAIEDPTADVCASVDLELARLSAQPWIDVTKRSSPALHAWSALRDQYGQEISPASLYGKPLALSFLYTRCRNPRRCPAVADSIAQLQELIRACGLADSVRLALMTYEPDFDTPERMRAYAISHGIEVDETIALLAPSLDDNTKSAYEHMDIGVTFVGNNVATHGIRLLVLDRNGRVARQYRALLWDSLAVLEDLRRLLEEPRE